MTGKILKSLTFASFLTLLSPLVNSDNHESSVTEVEANANSEITIQTDIEAIEQTEVQTPPESSEINTEIETSSESVSTPSNPEFDNQTDTETSSQELSENLEAGDVSDSVTAGQAGTEVVEETISITDEELPACELEELEKFTTPQPAVLNSNNELVPAEDSLFESYAASCLSKFPVDRAKTEAILQLTFLTAVEKNLTIRINQLQSVGALNSSQLSSFIAKSDELSSLKIEANKKINKLIGLSESSVSEDTLNIGREENNFILCSKGIDAINLEITKIEDYAKACIHAHKTAIQRNDADKLDTLRTVVGESIESLNSAIDKNISTDLDTKQFNAKTYLSIKSAVKRLEKISKKNSQLPLIANWQNQPFTFQFYTGLDVSKVTGVDTNESARLGLLTYFRPDRQLQELRESVGLCNDITKSCGKWSLGYIPHAYLSLTSSTRGDPANDESEKSIDWEGGVFWPWYIGRRGETFEEITEFIIGPIWTRGSLSVEDNEENFDREYTGIRLAFNEEMYFDLMRGRSVELKGSRYNLRGQFPVTELGNGRIFFGFEIITDSFEDSRSNRDLTNFFLVWQTSFDDLWNAGSSAED